MYEVYFNALNLIVLLCKITISLLSCFFFSTIHRYPHRNSTAATASTVVVVVSKEEEERSFMVNCCLLFSLLVYSSLLVLS